MTTPTKLATCVRAAVPLLATVLLAAGCGTFTADQSDGESGTDDGGLALFDASVVHEISVTFDEGDYDEMIEMFADTGEKISIEATVTIDGHTYEQAGLRLKGNSSLAGLGGAFGGRGGPGGRGGDTAGGDEEGDGGEDGGGGENDGRPGGGLGSADADTPEDLPWLIELDEFVDQSHDGYEDIVIRSNNSETALNEAVALALLAEAGLASQEAMATSFSVNGSDEVLRLAIEHPDDDAWYERSFDDEDGALYKAESTGNWTYRGDDPEEYDEVFDQEGGKDVTDLTPLIEFLEFINESDDDTFAAELPDRLDVDAFATYLAMMELVDNFDDIDGPGNNGYLWWDAETEQFTVVPWDLNLAFGGLGDGPGGGPGGFQPPDGVELPEGFDPGQLPDGFDPGDLPEGVDPSQLPDGAPELPDGFDPSQVLGGPGGGGRGFGGGSNPLVERFHEVDEFEALYQDKLTTLRGELFDSGVADKILASWVDTLTEQASDLVDAATVEDEADALRSSFDSDG